MFFFITGDSLGTLRRLRYCESNSPLRPCGPRAACLCLPICPTTPNRESRADDASRGQPFWVLWVGSLVAFGSGRRAESSGLAVSQPGAITDHSPSFPANSHRFGTPPCAFLLPSFLAPLGSGERTVDGARSRQTTARHHFPPVRERKRAVTTDEDGEGRAHGRRRPPALFFSFPNFSSKRCCCCCGP